MNDKLNELTRTLHTNLGVFRGRRRMYKVSETMTPNVICNNVIGSTKSMGLSPFHMPRDPRFLCFAQTFVVPFGKNMTMESLSTIIRGSGVVDDAIV